MTCQKKKKRKEKRHGPTKSLRETMIPLKFEEFLNSAIRASTTGMVNVSNAKYLTHLPHQIQK